MKLITVMWVDCWFAAVAFFLLGHCTKYWIISENTSGCCNPVLFVGFSRGSEGSHAQTLMAGSSAFATKLHYYPHDLGPIKDPFIDRLTRLVRLGSIDFQQHRGHETKSLLVYDYWLRRCCTTFTSGAVWLLCRTINLEHLREKVKAAMLKVMVTNTLIFFNDSVRMLCVSHWVTLTINTTSDIKELLARLKCKRTCFHGHIKHSYRWYVTALHCGFLLLWCWIRDINNVYILFIP